MLKENRPLALATVATAPVLWREPSQPVPFATGQRKATEALRNPSRPYAISYNDCWEAAETLPPSIRVLLVDTQVIVHAGLRSLLADARDMVVVGEATQSAEALRLAARLQPNVIIIDPQLPGLDGFDTIRRLRQLCPASQVVVLTTTSAEQTVQAAIQAGAIGYLLKDVGKPDLLRALRAAAQGEPTLHPAAQRALMYQKSSAPFQELTERELDVLRLIGQGCSNRTIAATLCLTEGTVKGYVSTILAKLEVADRTQAALYAVKHGLIPHAV